MKDLGEVLIPLLGVGAVGKTSITMMWNDPDKPFQEEYKCSDGLSTYKMVVKTTAGDTIHVILHDTNGRDNDNRRYGTKVVTEICKDADGVIFVFDFMAKRTLTRVEMNVKNINELSERLGKPLPPMAFIGNKGDNPVGERSVEPVDITFPTHNDTGEAIPYFECNCKGVDKSGPLMYTGGHNTGGKNSKDIEKVIPQEKTNIWAPLEAILRQKFGDEELAIHSMTQDTA